MKNTIGIIITSIIVITLSVLGFVLGGINLSKIQTNTLIILLIICASSMAYCFIIGELVHNNSQMDKLWSILPIAYTWVICAMGGFKIRLLIFAIIVTIWGFRLTFNFARKGAYKLKFWQGEEDYRWAILRKNKYFSKRFIWALFDLLFISIYQNLLVLAICLPALAVMDSNQAFNGFDALAIGLSLTFILLEFIADEQQWKFHQKKKELLADGKKLEDIEAPYNKGFNTTGIWARAKHPNYLGEQGVWMSLYIFTIGAGVTVYGIFNWTIFAPLFLIFLFLGSSQLGEAITNSKYPEYKYYRATVSKYFPLKKYNYEKAKAKLDK